MRIKRGGFVCTSYRTGFILNFIRENVVSKYSVHRLSSEFEIFGAQWLSSTLWNVLPDQKTGNNLFV